MNIKTFLILNISDVLPSDVKYYILHLVRNSASQSIQNIYILNISRNMDIFLKLIDIYNRAIRCGFYDNNFSYYNHEQVSKYIIYINKNIKYNYIQDPESWIYYLDFIIGLYGDFKKFNVNSVYNIINNIHKHQSIITN